MALLLLKVSSAIVWNESAFLSSSYTKWCHSFLPSVLILSITVFVSIMLLLSIYSTSILEDNDMSAAYVAKAEMFNIATHIFPVFTNAIICFKRHSADQIVSMRMPSTGKGDSERWESLFKKAVSTEKRAGTTYSTVDTSASGMAPRICYEALKDLQLSKAPKAIGMHMLCIVRVDRNIDAKNQSAVRIRWFNFNSALEDERILADLRIFLQS
ncbi:hypothetical protein CYMTET_44340 [Cymbomonas tetramitiformis]|uniref:Uncharacterized protein n=1 Tax=Cymbomonas tetramitiformis TaxID=36881 RepID=A0AAE0C1M3_9CHLO|nr:hypothetical protein CYMTET_44340 [Cymbomonas tetramitiformis]